MIEGCRWSAERLGTRTRGGTTDFNTPLTALHVIKVKDKMGLAPMVRISLSGTGFVL